jgi:hypothetical protein
MIRKVLAPMLLCLAIVAGSIAVAEEMKEPGQKKAEIKLPPGWTAEDMQACAAAATPGKNHEYLTKAVGTWTGKSTMWMFPDAESVTSECTLAISSMMDGRYTRVDWKGDMPGMGPFTGMGTQGYDNVGGKFVCTWIDNMSTAIMNGTGELSPDGKTMTWTYNFVCPLNKKPMTMRQVESSTDDNSKTLEMFSPDPKSGKEFKMMHIELTRK